MRKVHTYLGMHMCTLRNTCECLAYVRMFSDLLTEPDTVGLSDDIPMTTNPC